MATKLPNGEAIRQLLGMLLGTTVKIVKAQPMIVSQAKAAASYVDADKTLKFVVLVDLPFVASVGAALAMIPPAVAAEVIKSGKPTETIQENAYEVLNVAASLFNEVPETPIHVKIAGFETANPTLPRELLMKLLKPAERLDCEVAITGHVNSKVSLFALP